MTEVSNVASRRPQAPPRTRRRYQSSGATSNSIIQNFMPRSFLPRLSVDRMSSILPPQPQPSMSTFRHPDGAPGPDLPLPPPALLHSRGLLNEYLIALRTEKGFSCRRGFQDVVPIQMLAGCTSGISSALIG